MGKTGADAMYQGVVSGQITINNNQATPLAVFSINNAVKGGQAATVTCGAGMPFQARWHWLLLVPALHTWTALTWTAVLQVPACASTVCRYVVHYLQPLGSGNYTMLASVNLQPEGAPAPEALSATAEFRVCFGCFWCALGV